MGNALDFHGIFQFHRSTGWSASWSTVGTTVVGVGTTIARVGTTTIGTTIVGSAIVGSTVPVVIVISRVRASLSSSPRSVVTP